MEQVDYSKITAEDIKALTEKLSDEELKQCIASIPEDLILNLRKEMNPYGRVIEGSDATLLFSYTDLREKYLLKLLTTTFIAYLNRACDEWNVPNNVPVIPVYDYVKNPSLLSDPSILPPEELAKLTPEELKSYQAKEPTRQQYAEILEENRKQMEKRIVVKEFLESLFQFDPDRHVRSAYRPNVSDPERQLLETDAAKLAFQHASKTDKILKSELDYIQTIKASAEAAGHSLPNKIPEPSITRKNATEMIPPADFFHRFMMYFEENYEELRGVVTDIYCEKADLERAINPHAWFTDQSAKQAGFKDAHDAAKKYIDKHKKETIAAIYQATSGMWNFFGPFKEVRDRVDFYNDNTQILKEMADQIDRDSQLGRDLMKKKMEIEKKKNIQRDGPDDPAFLKWKAENSALKSMGATTLEEEDECPKDAIQVDVFRLSKGGQKLEKGKFYTKAEAPEHMLRK